MLRDKAAEIARAELSLFAAYLRERVVSSKLGSPGAFDRVLAQARPTLEAGKTKESSKVRPPVGPRRLLVGVPEEPMRRSRFWAGMSASERKRAGPTSSYSRG